MIDLNDLPKDLANRNVELPNVYFVTVMHHTKGVESFYLAADSTPAAYSKVRRLCMQDYGYRPTRTTTDIKYRRFMLGDYLENPQGLAAAAEMAKYLNERSTVQALEGRMAKVQSILRAADTVTSDNIEAVMDLLGAELRAIEAQCA